MKYTWSYDKLPATCDDLPHSIVVASGMIRHNKPMTQEEASRAVWQVCNCSELLIDTPRKIVECADTIGSYYLVFGSKRAVFGFCSAVHPGDIREFMPSTSFFFFPDVAPVFE